MILSNNNSNKKNLCKGKHGIIGKEANEEKINEKRGKEKREERERERERGEPEKRGRREECLSANDNAHLKSTGLTQSGSL